jgi:predicted PurR-regulated permease PerM
LANVLRPLALANLAVAVAFALPLFAWVVAEHFSRGSLVVSNSVVETTEQTLAQIRSSNNIEDLRRRAQILAEMRDFDRKHEQLLNYYMTQMYQWVWIFMGIVSAAFVANAGLLYWAFKRGKRASQPATARKRAAR